MKSRISFLLTVMVTLIIIMGSCSNQVQLIENGKKFTKMTIYKNWDKEGPIVVTDKEDISKIIKKVNMSPRENLSDIQFEQGPDGRIIFDGNKSTLEIRVFSLGGHVVTENYYIKTAINLDEFTND